MAEITVVHIGLLTLAIVVGVVLGWVIRGRRCAQEKDAVSEGWQEQLEAQRSEQKRLIDQNKRLMEQVNQLQASGKDATNRARELSDALKEAFERRDELQREIKEVRSSLQSAVSERDRLQADIEGQPSEDTNAAIKARDDKIFALSRELENWQNRLPPLIERFRVRNEEAEKLERQLEAAQTRISDLEQGMLEVAGQTMVESVETEPSDDALVASNDPADEESFEDDSADAGVDEDDSPDTVDEDESGIHAGNARDDLKLIKGVGPAIEKTLNELGIFRFSQIADMSEYDIDRVARRLKGFRSRIYREDWIGQARELDEQHAGEHA
jgi:predicted flap endonuclease-1-like 5' DNA nuclease/uncharacterized protein YoxC